MTVFYTALYHAAIVPNLNMDVDRHYGEWTDRFTPQTDLIIIPGALGYLPGHASTVYHYRPEAHTRLYQNIPGHVPGRGRLPVWELASSKPIA